jgi:hypothetical protein
MPQKFHTTIWEMITAFEIFLMPLYSTDVSFDVCQLSDVHHLGRPSIRRLLLLYKNKRKQVMKHMHSITTVILTPSGLSQELQDL